MQGVGRIFCWEFRLQAVGWRGPAEAGTPNVLPRSPNEAVQLRIDNKKHESETAKPGAEAFALAGIGPTGR